MSKPRGIRAVVVATCMGPVLLHRMKLPTMMMAWAAKARATRQTRMLREQSKRMVRLVGRTGEEKRAEPGACGGRGAWGKMLRVRGAGGEVRWRVVQGRRFWRCLDCSCFVLRIG